MLNGSYNLNTMSRRHPGDLAYKDLPVRGPIMVKHGALSKSHVYQLLRSNDPRVVAPLSRC
jgi:hypothetical protein